ncbi:MAG: ABC transporter ATP-binding protein [Bacteroidales bacterium]|nr:ABC transporter ATP-binding protein [Bacteroidales bacterium]
MNVSNEHIITIRDLWLGYQPGKYLVEAADVVVRKGEMVAVIGRNGSGKSTLLRTLAGIQKPLKGSIQIEKIPLSEYHSRKLATMISHVGTGLKTPENLTVFETVSLGRHPYTNWWGGLRKADRDKITESIRFVGMTPFLDKHLDTLSDGERQRVMIAMALAQDTKIILLDEPTAFLDIPNKMEIAEVLCNMKKSGKSVIFSTHDFDSAIQHADKLWLLHKNQILQGAPEDLGLAAMFDLIFKESELTFDDVSLRFRRSETPDKLIQYKEGEDRISRWTAMMLARTGFRVQSTGGTEIPKLTIEKSEEKITWNIQHGTSKKKFYSLYEVAIYLTQNT